MVTAGPLAFRLQLRSILDDRSTVKGNTMPPFIGDRFSICRMVSESQLRFESTAENFGVSKEDSDTSRRLELHNYRKSSIDLKKIPIPDNGQNS